MTDWIPVALSRSAEPGRVIGSSARGQQLAIWRGSTGPVHVWRDRCPHRGMRFSLGFVRGEHLGCPYHGWRFAPDGRCAFVPAHPDLIMPATVAAQSLPGQEAAGMVWVDLDADPTPDALPASCIQAMSGVRSVVTRSPVEPVMALLDSLASPSWPDGADAQWSGLLASYSGGALLIGVQPLDRERTALHLCCRESAGLAFAIEIAQLAGRLRDRQPAAR